MIEEGRLEKFYSRIRVWTEPWRIYSSWTMPSRFIHEAFPCRIYHNDSYYRHNPRLIQIYHILAIADPIHKQAITQRHDKSLIYTIFPND